jgi:ElaB/YqjD/DUF883 family membrane-anchored ribosome-binding protein
MENDTLNQKTNASIDAAKTAARDVSNASTEVGNAAMRAAGDVRKATEAQMSTIKSDIDAFVAKLPSLSDVDLNAAKQKLLDNFASARSTVQDYATDAQDKLARGVDAGGAYVKERPVQSMLAATALGLLIGALLSRRS